MDFETIKRESTGRWPMIFSALGIDVGNGKHKPCPVCGGTDRFRFDDKAGRGTWFCNQCGAGDGFKLVCRFLGVDYAEAMRRVAEVVGHIDHPPPKQTRPKIDIQKNRRRLIQLWESSRECTGDDPVTKYLRGRGLFMAINDVRYCPGCYEAETKSNMPAMVAKVRNPQGKPVSIHRTYLNGAKKASIKSPKKLMPRTEPLAGSAIRLFAVDKTVGVAEGIETAIAAMQLTLIPTWATISSGMLEAFQPPDGIREIVIFGDCDPNYVGQAAAFKLAKRLYQNDYLVEVRIPECGDWADHLKSRQVERRIASTA
jgi:putative DNA primase/helicase